MIICYDTETYEQKENGKYRPVLDTRQFRLGSYTLDGLKFNNHFDNKQMAEDLLKIIEENLKKKKRIYIYAHNHIYDFLAVFKERLLFNPDFQLISTDRPFLGIYKEKCYFLDTMALYPIRS